MPLSVIQSVVDGRNYLYRWLFAHHNVVYNQHLLQKAVTKLASLISPDDSNKFLSKFFSVEAFIEDTNCGEGVNAYLPTDQDIMVLLKKHRSEIPEAEELLSRSHARKALWKTAVECERIFKQKSEQELIMIQTSARDVLTEMVNANARDIGFVVERVPQKFVSIKTGDVLILGIDEQSHSYDDLFVSSESQGVRNSFYVYAPLECINMKQQFINRLKDLSA